MLSIADQLEVQVSLGYPALAGLSDAAYRALAAPAIAVASSATRGSTSQPGPGVGHLSALLVVTRHLISDEARVPLLRLEGSNREGILDKNHFSDARHGLSHYVPRAELDVPDAPFYVALDVDRGDEFRDVRPTDALATIAERNRTPLTIDEGLSFVAAFPEALVKNHCFTLGGSSRGDARMPAIWIAEKAPKLGWCYERNPHSWLGVASAAGRVRP